MLFFPQNSFRYTQSTLKPTIEASTSKLSSSEFSSRITFPSSLKRETKLKFSNSIPEKQFHLRSFIPFKSTPQQDNLLTIPSLKMQTAAENRLNFLLKLKTPIEILLRAIQNVVNSKGNINAQDLQSNCTPIEQFLANVEQNNSFYSSLEQAKILEALIEAGAEKPSLLHDLLNFPVYNQTIIELIHVCLNYSSKFPINQVSSKGDSPLCEAVIRYIKEATTCNGNSEVIESLCRYKAKFISEKYNNIWDCMNDYEKELNREEPQDLALRQLILQEIFMRYRSKTS